MKHHSRGGGVLGYLCQGSETSVSVSAAAHHLHGLLVVADEAAVQAELVHLRGWNRTNRFPSGVKEFRIL